jgi:hypothetical protein
LRRRRWRVSRHAEFWLRPQREEDDLRDHDEEEGGRDISDDDENKRDKRDRIDREPDGHAALGADQREAGA